MLTKDEVPTKPGNWHKISTSTRDGVPRAPPLYLWYNLGKSMANLSKDEKDNLITEIDVLFGDDRPWYGFETIDPPTTPGQEDRMESAHITLRKGVKGTDRVGIFLSQT